MHRWDRAEVFTHAPKVNSAADVSSAELLLPCPGCKLRFQSGQFPGIRSLSRILSNCVLILKCPCILEDTMRPENGLALQ